MQAARIAAASGAGYEGTVASSPEGAAPADTEKKQLLGY